MGRHRKPPQFTMTTEHRVKIQNSNILNALVEHIEGRREMAATQVTAALGLLRKVMPDLAAVEHSGETKVIYDIASDPISPEQWAEQHATTH